MTERIKNYIEYLINEHSLYISLHLSEKYTFNTKLLYPLKKYNIHTNPYCFYVKNIKNEVHKCIEYQQKVLEISGDKISYFEPCHAGVNQYIHKIKTNGETAGFIAISEKEKFSKELFDTLVYPLSLMLSELLSDIPSYQNDDIYLKILEYLDKNYNVTLDEISQKFGYSKSYISHMFRKKSGYTLKAYCNMLKIRDAKTLLENTDLSVTDIALSSGFNNFSYFINTFKTVTGITPLKWRKKVSLQ